MNLGKFSPVLAFRANHSFIHVGLEIVDNVNILLTQDNLLSGITRRCPLPQRIVR